MADGTSPITADPSPDASTPFAITPVGPDAPSPEAGVTLQQPINAPMNSGYGERAAPIAGAGNWHPGLDYAAKPGSAVSAAADGTVQVARPTTGGYGNEVRIVHDDGTSTLYGHLSTIGVKQGQTVTAGQTIGAVGSTGLSTGPHLHFGYYDAKGNPQDPTPFFDTGDTPPTSELNAHFGVGTSSAPTSPGAPSAAVAPPPDDGVTPPTDELNAHFGVQPGQAGQGPGGLPAGTLQILPDKAGTYHDQSGTPWAQDSADPTLFTNPKGDQYRVVNAKPPAPPVAAPVQTNAADQAVRGAAQGGLTDATQVGAFVNNNALGMLGSVQHSTDAIADALRGVFGASPPGPQTATNIQQDIGSANQAAFPMAPRDVPGPVQGFLDVQPQTPGQRIARAAGTGFGMMAAAGPAGVAESGSVPLSVLRNALTGTAAGAASQGASELAPDAWKPAVGTAAGIVTALGLHGAGVLGSGALDAAGGAVKPFAAAVLPKAAESQAGDLLAAKTSDLGATRNALTGETTLVPGSKPTTFQASGDLGLGAAERADRLTNPEPYAGIASDQNAARVKSLADMQTGGDPQALGKAVADHFAKIDQDTQASVDQATQAAQAKTQALGGSSPPEAQGADLRAAITDAEDNARAREGAVWNAVDPDGTLTANATGTKAGLADIEASVRPTATPISPAERQIYDAAKAMPNISPAADLVALKQNIRAAMSQELATNGRTPVYARLSQAMNAVQDNLNKTIGDTLTPDTSAASAQAPQVSQVMTPAARLAQVLEDARQSGQSVALGGDRLGNGPAAGRGAPSVPGSGGAGVPTPGGPGGASGNPPLSGTPTFDAAAQARLAAANAATRERATTFGVRPVSNVTATTGMKGQFRLPDGSVPGQFFKSGPSGFDTMTRAIKAGGDKALGVLQDYAAGSLRRAAENPDGSIDPAKFARWKAANQDALRALPPETQARFADAASAGEAVQDAAASRALAIKNAKATALSKVIDPQGNPLDADAITKTVGSMLRGKTGAQDLGALADSVRSNPEAFQGLRQAVADHIAQSLTGNAEVGTSGQAGLKSDQFQSFVKQNRAALSKVFEPDEMARLDSIAADLQRSQRSNNALKVTAGSDTIQNAAGVKRAASMAGVIGKHVGLDILSARLGEGLGQALGHHIPGADIAGSVGAVMVSEALQRLRAVGINRVSDLVSQGIQNPDVYMRLTEKVANTPVAQRNWVNGLVRAAGKGVWSSQGATQSTAPPRPILSLPPRNALQGVALR